MYMYMYMYIGMIMIKTAIKRGAAHRGSLAPHELAPDL